MKALVRYTAVVIGIAGAAALATWPFLDAAGRVSLAWAVAVTVPTQVLFFALLATALRDATKFMAWWALGVLGRMLLVALVGFSIGVLAVPAPTVLMMSTVSLFSIFLLLEPVFLTRPGRDASYAQRA